MKVAVTGATGRMGRAVRDLLEERSDASLAVATSRSPADETARTVEDSANLPALLRERSADVVVDFTAPSASVDHAATAAEVGIPIVIGTTGFEDEQVSALASAGERVPVLLGANFSRGVQALIEAVATAVESLPAYDVEVTETHHNEKPDAPSGTAKVILDAIDDARDLESERVHGREGETPRSRDEIGVHARRAGDVTGEHEVLLAGNEEVLSLTHRAGSRYVFAAGALDAAAWLREQEPALYRFTNVADQLT
ncbi:MAG: 4-hydroxy-tetrahydrodipicolinate reductase [Halanaeroarchaeum sp.]